MHINDWAAILTLFDKMNKQLERMRKVRPRVHRVILSQQRQPIEVEFAPMLICR